MPSNVVDPVKASLEAAKVGFLTATSEMNDAKSRYEDAKGRLDTEINAAKSQYETEKRRLETEMNGLKSRYEAEKSQLKTESDKQKLRILELEKQLDPYGKEKKVGNPKVFMNIGNGRVRIVIELFNHITPQAAQRFQALCTGKNGYNAENGGPLHYKGTEFYFKESGEYCSGGFNVKGEAGETIKENFIEKQSDAGDVCLWSSSACVGIRTYFWIRMKDNYGSGSAVFGRVVEGLDELRKAWNAGCVNTVITDCGVLP